MTYVDTNIFVYLLENTPKLGRLAAELLTAQQTAGEVLVSSTLTFTEFIAGAKDENAAALLLSVPVSTFIAVDQEIAISAGTLQRKHGLKIGDAIHLASCLQAQCTSLITNDLKLAKVAANYVTVIQL